MSSDDYVRIHVVIEAKSERAVRLSNGEVHAWVPRSCLHGADDQLLNALGIGDEHILRVREWVAEREGFI